MGRSDLRSPAGVGDGRCPGAVPFMVAASMVSGPDADHRLLHPVGSAHCHCRLRFQFFADYGPVRHNAADTSQRVSGLYLAAIGYGDDSIYVDLYGIIYPS